jgi:hypothetical protein
MRLFEDARSYANSHNAEVALDKALAKIGKTAADVNWFIMVQGNGRFSPVVSIKGDNRLCSLIHLGICVVA